MRTNDGKLPVSIKLEPSIPDFVKDLEKEFENKSTINNTIDKILKDKDGLWSSKIINFIKEKSKELYDVDLSEYFRVSKVVTGIKEIPIKNSNGTTSVFNSKYESTYIGLNYEYSFLFVEQFKMIFNILKMIKNNDDLKCKMQFTFNNIPLLIYTFNSSDKIVLTNKSKRDNANIPKNNDEFLKFLNDTLNEK